MDQVNRNKNIKEIIEWILCIVIAVVLALLVRYFIFTPTVVKMRSMLPTLVEGDRLFLDRLSITMKKELKKGDIITFEAPSRKEITQAQFDKDRPIAIYNNEPTNLVSKFLYYVLEIGKESYIKRVIGVAGDHVLIDSEGRLYINGIEQKEEYLPENVKTPRMGVFYDITVPEGYIFAMGDNRGESTDCRSFGCIPINKVESKVFTRFWPFNKFGKVN